MASTLVITDAGEARILNHSFGGIAFTFPTGIELGLSTTTVGDAGIVTEPSGFNYSRFDASGGGTDWTITNKQIQNARDFDFGTATGGNWGTIQDIFMAYSAGPAIGEVFASATLDTQFPVNDTENFTVQAAQLQWTWRSTGYINAFAQALMRHFFGVSSQTAPTGWWTGISEVNPNEDGAGISEPSDANYARAAITWNAVSGTSPTTINNNGDIDFANPVGAAQSWNAQYSVVFDAATLGNPISYNAWTTPKSISAGKNVRIDDTTLAMTCE